MMARVRSSSVVIAVRFCFPWLCHVFVLFFTFQFFVDRIPLLENPTSADVIKFGLLCVVLSWAAWA
jgi:hypothetical protein